MDLEQVLRKGHNMLAHMSGTNMNYQYALVHPIVVLLVCGNMKTLLL